jgi:hypothetical protein
VALTLDEFEGLLADAVIRPVRGRIAVYPFLVLWPGPTSDGRWRATGYVEIEGFAASGRWRIPVHSVNEPEPLDSEREKRALLEAVHRRIADGIRSRLGACEVYVAEVESEGGGVLPDAGPR